MSLYGLVFGEKNAVGRGAILLPMLGFSHLSDVGRFRDAWVERDADGEPVIAVYTRNGGGNRVCNCDLDTSDGPCCGEYASIILPHHPQYLRDADDGFDPTYATFYFRPSPQHIEELRAVATDPVDTGDRWRRVLDALKPENKP